MSRKRVFIESSNDWETVNYGIYVRPLVELLPGFTVMATDRNSVIMDDSNVIYGIQSESYTLIPNALIKRCVDETIGNHEVKILYNPKGEFSINVYLPEESFSIGDKRDTIQKSVIINNSYNARVPFSVQGKVVNVTEDRVREKGMRVSYYRQICSNGLMGWSDEFMSMDVYTQWLIKGMPHKFNDFKEYKTYIDEGVEQVRRQEEQIFQKNFKHKSINLEFFEENLKSLFSAFMVKQDSLTIEVYRKMHKASFADHKVEGLIIDAGIPKKLASLALERLDEERQILDADSNLWLIYNAANFSLFSEKSGLAVDKRYEYDRKIFHNLNLQLVGNSEHKTAGYLLAVFLLHYPFHQTPKQPFSC